MSQEPDTLGEVFRAYQQDVRRLCRRMLGDEQGAEDAASEAFLRAHQRRGSYDAGRPMRAWLLSIAAHHCIDLLRRRSTEKRLFEDLGADPDDLAGGGASPLQQILGDEERTAILAAVDALPVKYRLPLVLRLPGKEVSSALTAPSAVRPPLGHHSCERAQGRAG